MANAKPENASNPRSNYMYNPLQMPCGHVPLPFIAPFDQPMSRFEVEMKPWTMSLIVVGKEGDGHT